MLCERCQRFDIQAFGRDPHPYRGVSLLSVIRSSNHCSFCSLLLDSLQKATINAYIKEAINTFRGPQQKFTQLLRCCSASTITTLLTENWVNFEATKAIKRPVAGTDGLNIASIDAFVGSIDIPDPKWRGYVKFHVAADRDTAASTSQDITGQIATDRPWSSGKSIKSIKTWHRHCVSNHPECCKTLSGTQSCQIENPLLPTRCIETILVATTDGASSWRHILRETADQRGQYISLSHRWNEETKISKTTAANYMRRIGKSLQETDHTRTCASDIDWMPRLFVDTCTLAHKLGIKYVWIDSICIRQDDDDEWNREAPEMARYYQNAWATVVAANNTADNGLLNMRREEPVPRMARLPYMDKNGEQKGYFYLQLARPDMLQKDFSVGVRESELLQRGWVFQEWRLSRRVIAFSDSGFFLHCHTSGPMSPMGDHFNGVGVQPGHVPESGGRNMQGLGFRDHRSINFRDLRDNIGLGDNRGLDDPPPIIWEAIVSEYSGLGLTYLSQDRLIALAGVASEVGRIMQALNDTSDISGPILSDDVLARQYVCGLWLSNIHEGLVWEQGTPGSRERVPGIPTWSWASMASPITDENDKRVLKGMSVRWLNSGFSKRQRQRVCAIHKATTIPVNNQTWIPQFSNRPVPDNVPEYEYGNKNRFVILTFYGSLILVQIENLLSEQDADLANEVTTKPNNGPLYNASDPRLIAPDTPWGAGLWRGICVLVEA